MSIPFKSLLGDVLSQIRSNKKEGASPSSSGSFRPMTDQERLQRGVDPRDPNRMSIDDGGSVLTTLIGWSPDRMGGSGKNISGRLSELLSAYGAANQAADMAGGGFNRPMLKGDGGSKLADRLNSSEGKRIPKAKSEATRVSPGMYRDAKGNLVRK